MELALYHPEFGYYTRRDAGVGLRPLGRRGDFYTSVSVGETFGLLLAHRLVHEWETFFVGARPFVVVEQGGHDGQFARDLLAGLREIGTPLLADIQYRLVEPREELRPGLEASVAPGDPIRVVPSLAEARAPVGLFLCNELLDAFPVDLLLFENGAWRERRVGWDIEAGRPTWVDREPAGALADFAAELGGGYPDGYRTEVCPGVDAWMDEAAGLFKRGLWWIIDYGHERADYYRPDRTSGTLRCYRDHRAGDDPFAHPGAQDITAHVDFTRLEHAAVRAGLAKRSFADQHHFLVEAAKPWLLSLEGGPPDAAAAKRLRQFQTLAHPAMMGQRFQVLELARE